MHVVYDDRTVPRCQRVNKKEGLLDISAHVTVKGEEAGSARAVGSFWGKVTSGPHRAPGAIVDTYFVEVDLFI